jgi:hypothetical protein
MALVYPLLAHSCSHREALWYYYYYYFKFSVRIEPSGYGRHPPLGIRPFLVTYTFLKFFWPYSSPQKPPKCAGLLSSQGPQGSLQTLYPSLARSASTRPHSSSLCVLEASRSASCGQATVVSARKPRMAFVALGSPNSRSSGAFSASRFP